MPVATRVAPRDVEATLTPPSPLGNWAPEGAVLSYVLDQHPRRLTLAELAREVGRGIDGDIRIERAVDNLRAARLLQREGTDLVPSPSVVRFDRLGATEASTL